MKKRILAVFTSFCLLFVSCWSYSCSDALAKSAPKLSSKSFMLVAGGKQTVKLTGGKGSWSIADESVAKISSSGSDSAVVVPVKAGKTTLSCSVGSRTLSCSVNVLNNEVGSPKDMFGPDDPGIYMFTGMVMEMDYVDKSTAANPGISIAMDDDDEEYDFEEDEYEDDDDEAGSADEPIKAVGHDPNYFSCSEKNGVTRFKALHAGKTSIEIVYVSGREQSYPVVIINPLRGKTKVKNTTANYRKWRNKWIKDYMSPDTTTWELIEGIGYLGNSGTYKLTKKKPTPQLFWYKGIGTCASGARLFTDFLKTVGVYSRVHSAKYDWGGEDIFEYNIMYGSDHKNAQIKLGGKKYTINSQPENMWPVGILEGWE